MQFWDLYARGNKKIWLRVPGKEVVETQISAVENNIVWLNLPRKDGQILMLEKAETVDIGFSYSDGFYSAETKVAEIGITHGKVYGLSIPKEFVREQRRYFVRSKYSTKVLFTSESKYKITTELFNFSAGGLRVYVTPEFEAMLQNEKFYWVDFQIEKKTFSLPTELVWLKYMDNILNAGFKFIQIREKDQEVLMALAIKYSKNF
ncbi:PilZ domain-containing protein [Desulforamulus aeronauticus]|uniref:C-di-GMP-binding flagellar brake protein YcgR, contains PilZNR and PilZ domains n=1 Tax=Desulforamulus aeronauticus DSM 10349 TaxID=1121421 RepID=A0A1M6XCV3_9FIRM|nr:PilZ domain-containing protein [Desulforamulus aeronauticus]SHL03709.1 c-di-GMP-binding flagellar brake protein YcgR, contains PilZNR and PilZ domains [Desulforamulus aeronauticus DSM 10349]